MDDKYITEAEYQADLDGALTALSERIAASGLTIAAIARGTRMRWETVYHASKKIAVRFDSARRIEYYLKSITS